jgi:pimeloyl-ACP methyl ester carboxylesterase
MRFAVAIGLTSLSVAISACSLTSASANYDLYETPRQRVAIGSDRYIHMVCMGEGSPTAILSAGAGGWSGSWRLVQPQLAKTTKACTWDRAGNGFSSGSPEPQDLMHTAGDLERALDGAGIRGPLVMVAHSVGSFETLVFADRHPERVVGMVLVDPSTPDQVEQLPAAAPALMAWSAKSDQLGFDKIRVCIKADRSGETSPRECASLLSNYPDPLRTNLLKASNAPMYWEAYLSLLDQRQHSSKMAMNDKRNYGSMPLTVLNAGLYNFPTAPAEAQGEVQALKAKIKAEQEAIARLSSQGTLETIADSSHGIPLQKPEAVIDAVRRVIQLARDNVAIPAADP